MFEWDDAKRRANRALRGIDFAEAERFDWSAARVLPDERRDYGEPRWQAYGAIGARLHVLVFTIRAGRIRVISLRKANAREQAKWARHRG